MEFVEDRAVRLLHHIREDRKAAAVRHADDDIVDAQLTAALDDLLHRGDQAFAAIKAKTLGAHVFYVEEFFKTLSLYEAVQNCFAAVLGKGDFFAETLNAFF